jgi:hypothetical protein
MNLLGQEIYTTKLNGSQSMFNISIPHLNSRLYLVDMRDGKGFTSAQKLIIQ